MPSTSIPRPLSLRQAAFVREYLASGNATAAYKAAGYRGKGHAAQSAAGRLLKHPAVAAAIAARREKLESKGDVSLEDLLEEHRCTAFSDLGDILDFTGDTLKMRPASEIPEHARRALQSVKVRRYTEGHGDDAREVEVIELKLWSKSDALKEIARLRGWHAPMKIAPTSPDGERPYQPFSLEAALERMAAMAMPARSTNADAGQAGTETPA